MTVSGLGLQIEQNAQILGSILVYPLQQVDCIRMTLPLGMLTEVDAADDIRGGNACMHTQCHVGIGDILILISEFMSYVRCVQEVSRLPQTTLKDRCIARLRPHVKLTLFVVVC